jgi:ATP-dependent Lon protease
MFLFWTNCPHCGGLVSKKAVLCKHCQSTLSGKSKKADRFSEECIAYLKNGFSKIEAECDVIEDRIKARTGFIFIRHQYSCEDLLEATKRIESFIGKMRDDLDEWESRNKLTEQVKFHFNRNAQEVYRRLEFIETEIERREPTWWEKVRTVIQRIFEKLFSIFSFKLIAGKKMPKEIAA